jgi:two-component system chemotaxis response regulator CheY
VRRDPRNRAIPILVLTTETEASKKQRAKDAGATGWIVKPFEPEKLLAAVRRVAP